MLSFLLSNKYLAIAKWIGIAIAVWYIFHTWDKAQKYDTIVDQRNMIQSMLTAEQKCTEGSKCATRIANDRAEAVKTAEKAQAQAAADNKKQHDELEAKQHEQLENLTKQYTQREKHFLEVLNNHSPSCAEWEKQINPCGMQ